MAMIWGLLSLLTYGITKKSAGFLLPAWTAIFIAGILHGSLLALLLSWIPLSLNFLGLPEVLDNVFRLGWRGMLLLLGHFALDLCCWRGTLPSLERLRIACPTLRKRVYGYAAASLVFALLFALPPVFFFCFTCYLLSDLYLEGHRSRLPWTLTWVLFFAFFHTQLLYKHTLARDWASMEQLASHLANPTDPLLLREIPRWRNLLEKAPQSVLLWKAWREGNLPSEQVHRELVQIVKPSPYARAHYRLEFASKIPDRAGFQFSPSGGAGYALACRKIGWLWISLQPEEGSRLVRLQGGYYKGLRALADHHAAIWIPSRWIYREGRFRFSNLESTLDAEEKGHSRIFNSRYMRYVYRGSGGLRVFVERRLGGYAKPMSFFSLTAAVGLCAVLLWLAAQWIGRQRVLPRGIGQVPAYRSLRSSIHRSFLFLTLCTLGLLSVTTLYYFERSQRQEIEQFRWEAGRQLATTFGGRFHGTAQQLESVARQHGLDFVYARSGKPLRSSFHFPPPGITEPFPFGDGRPEGLQEHILWHGKPLMRIWIPLNVPKGREGKDWLGIYFPDAGVGVNQDALDFLGALFSGYLLLMLSVSALTIYVSQTFTHPLDQLRQHIRLLRADASKKISWNRNDEVGQLVEAYNTAVDALWISAEKLKKRERESAWREMARQVAHEIRNPLTPMKLSLQHLQRTGKEEPERIGALWPRWAGTMLEQINTLDHIATAFSQFATMPPADNTAFDLGDLLDRLLDLYRQQEPQRHRFAYQAEAPSFPVYADKTQMQRVLTNLLNNAVQAIPPDSLGEISVYASRIGPDRMRLEIRDNGRGVDLEARPKIFSPYFTTRSSGTGLGLAMSRAIVENAGGCIGFQPLPDRGSCFWFELPLLATA